MTNHLYHQKSAIPQYYPQQKRPLTSPNRVQPIKFNYNNNNNNNIISNNNNNNLNYYQHHQHQQQQQQNNENGTDSNELNNFKQQYDELTESNLRKNAQIVLNNLKRNALQTLICQKLSDTNYIRHSINMSSPESDCNSNPHNPHHLHHHGGGGVGVIGGGIGQQQHPLGCSIASSQDFTHDNSDYQWFLDYGYRDGVTHNSILSSLSASYNGIGELSYYEDLARNIDANLAEVDIESFRANSLLTYRKDNSKSSPQHQTDDVDGNGGGDGGGGGGGVGGDLDNSICKSKQLFSPVRETQLSVDSLDLDCYPDDGDIILTCQANKDNYTIAFEGSVVYSDDSYYADGQHELNGKFKQNGNLLIDDIVKRKSLDVSMSRSDTGFTTWSKLKKNSSLQLQRYPSGNNNTSMNIIRHNPHCLIRKSSSLPNLQIRKKKQLNVSQAICNSSVDSYGKMRTLLPMCPMPANESSISESESPAPLQNSSSSNDPQPAVQPSFNLVKLFIKQKSSSTDTCMDVSSGLWPSDSNMSAEQRQRKKSMNDSGKGSALSRHDEDNENDFQYDSLDVPAGRNNDNTTAKTTTTTPRKGTNQSNDLYREVFDSPAHRNYTECNLNIKTHPKHLANVNNNNSFDKDSLKETNKSLSDTSRTSENITQLYTTTRHHIQHDTITRSIQTSVLLNSGSGIKVVPPSFLAQLNRSGKMKESGATPVYVIYPNYALPDLEFVNTTNHPNDVILSPLDFKEILPTKVRRPCSMTDAGSIRTKDYTHVIDWKSLAPLLPAEYRQMLKHIPEVDDLSESELSQRPMFCMSPPLRRNRSVSCDCNSICTLSSGSSQPPSSGFRGSSTLLTDSDVDAATGIATGTNASNGTPLTTTGSKDPLANMYVYQYNDNDGQATERPPSGRTVRGILRRNISTKGKSKRNSMFEEDHIQTHNLDKRRSLQEPYYASDAHNIIENYLAEMDNHNHHHHHHQKEHKLNNSRVSYRQYYPEEEEYVSKASKTNLNYITELTEEAKRRIGYCRNENLDLEARVRAENFLSNVPKSELKYYAEIANILESIENCSEAYDRKKLRNEVSKALSQKRVSFNQTYGTNVTEAAATVATGPNNINNNNINNINNNNNNNNNNLLSLGVGKEFTTPPNSPNISIAHLRMDQKQKSEKEKQDKIQSNRFKRLQIQWELLSKENIALEKELIKESRSGGSTPTSATKSKIPRPVSYPATKNPSSQAHQSKIPQSPSRLATPKKYGINATAAHTATATTAATAATGTTQTIRPRTPSKPHNTPKKTIPTSRTTTRCAR